MSALPSCNASVRNNIVRTCKTIDGEITRNAIHNKNKCVINRINNKCMCNIRARFRWMPKASSALSY